MTVGARHLAEALRSCPHTVREALNGCLERLFDSTARTVADSLPVPAVRDLPLAVYLADMMEQHQPGALLEYLRWVHTSCTGAEPDGERILETLICMSNVLRGAFPEQIEGVEEFQKAVAALVGRRREGAEEGGEEDDPLEPQAREYLEALLDTDRDRAWQIVEGALGRGFSIKDVYLGIFQRTQYEIGRLWQRNLLSVAQEHYCTARTQLIMTRLYPRIFSEHKRDRRLLAACAAGELHELGVRMVADFFEMEGWDTVYLGAGGSAQALLQAVETRRPHVVGLSATMPAHVRHVADLVEGIRRRFGDAPRILVGGRQFKIRPTLWRDVGADGFAPDAQTAVLMAETLVAGVP